MLLDRQSLREIIADRRSALNDRARGRITAAKPVKTGRIMEKTGMMTTGTATGIATGEQQRSGLWLPQRPMPLAQP